MRVRVRVGIRVRGYVYGVGASDLQQRDELLHIKDLGLRDDVLDEPVQEVGPILYVWVACGVGGQGSGLVVTVGWDRELGLEESMAVPLLSQSRRVDPSFTSE